MKSFWLTLCVAAVGLLWIVRADADEPGRIGNGQALELRLNVKGRLSFSLTTSDQSEKPTRGLMLANKLGQVRDDNGVSMKFVWCPPGIVPMEQLEQVTVTTDFWLGKYEVTQSEWQQVMNSEPWKDQDLTQVGPDYPATFVSWHDAVAFCRKMTEQERRAGRLSMGWEYCLPTEAQWELACRAGTETRFSFGNDRSQLGDYAWCGDNARNAGEQYAHRAGQKKPNSWGLYDMHGNVWEWCRDVYADKPLRGFDPVVEPTAQTESSDRVLKGGSWRYIFADWRSGLRYANKPEIQNALNGFRVALIAVPSDQPEASKADPSSGHK